MATYTLTIDAELLEAAKVEAERRNVSLDQVVADSLATFVEPAATTGKKSEAQRLEDRRKLLELMYEGPLGDIDRPLTREEIYAERTQWPRS